MFEGAMFVEKSSFLRTDSGSGVGWLAMENVSSWSQGLNNCRQLEPPPRDLIFFVPRIPWVS